MRSKHEKYVYKNKLFDAQMAHESRLQEIKDRKHDAFMHISIHLIDLTAYVKIYICSETEHRNLKITNIHLI